MLKDVADRVIFADLHNWGREGKRLKKQRIGQPCARLWKPFTILHTGEVAL